MIKVVGGLPVIEDFVAVLDRGEDGSNYVGGSEYVEGRDAPRVICQWNGDWCCQESARLTSRRYQPTTKTS
jgi:hypothetical protein